MDSALVREYFRYTFPPPDRPRVEMNPFRSSLAGQPRCGRAVDLAVSGVGVLFEVEIAAHLLEKLWDVSLILPAEPVGPGTLTLQATIAQTKRDPEGFFYGLEFFGIEKPAQTQLRKALWRFLLNCQKAAAIAPVPAAVPVPQA